MLNKWWRENSCVSKDSDVLKRSSEQDYGQTDQRTVRFLTFWDKWLKESSWQGRVTHKTALLARRKPKIPIRHPFSLFSHTSNRTKIVLFKKRTIFLFWIKGHLLHTLTRSRNWHSRGEPKVLKGVVETLNYANTPYLQGREWNKYA